MTDHSEMKFGLLERVSPSPRVLPMARYVDPAALTWPKSVDHCAPAGAYTMRLNSTLGTCTIAALANMVVTWVWLSTGKIIEIDDGEVLARYEQDSGFDGVTAALDVGCDPDRVMTHAVTEPFAGHPIETFVECGDLVLPAIAWFGAAYIALKLPHRAQSQAVWDIEPGAPLTGDDEPGSWGHTGEIARHLVLGVRYNEDGVTLITWSHEQPATHRWLAVYMEYAIAALSPEMFDENGMTIDGFDHATLRADLAKIAA